MCVLIWLSKWKKWARRFLRSNCLLLLIYLEQFDIKELIHLFKIHSILFFQHFYILLLAFTKEYVSKWVHAILQFVRLFCFWLCGVFEILNMLWYWCHMICDNCLVFLEEVFVNIFYLFLLRKYYYWFFEIVEQWLCDKLSLKFLILSVNVFV